MDIQEQINNYLKRIPEPKRSDMLKLSGIINNLMPNCKLWYLDGKNDNGKIVTNPQVGFGLQTIKYANGDTREFYQIGISANTSGISVYIIGIEDKRYLPETFGKIIGKAIVTGYCIKFKTIEDIKIDSLESAIRYGIEPSGK